MNLPLLHLQDVIVLVAKNVVRRIAGLLLLLLLEVVHVVLLPQKRLLDLRIQRIRY